MNNKDQTLNMTTGSILNNILLFSFPILIGNIFQQLYNIVDTAVIGNILGDDSLAAVGAAAPLYNLVIGFANGMTNGFSVVISRFFGADDDENMKKSVSLTYLITAVITIALTFLSLVFLDPILHLLKTPDNIFSGTKTYLGIIFAFSAVTMLYNMFAGMMRSIGNSIVPLVFLIISTAVNIVLDLLFVGKLSMGIAGAAYATVIAQAVSVVLCIVYIASEMQILKIRKKYLAPDGALITELASTGISMGLMMAVVSIGSVALQSAVNSLGADTITAHTASRKIFEIFILPFTTLTTAAATFTSQNYGAGNIERVKKGIKTTILISFVWAAICCVIAFIFGGAIIKALTGTENDSIVHMAKMYLNINFPFFFVLCILIILRSSLQGVGRKIIPLTGSVVELIAKFAAVGLIIVYNMGYFVVCILEPVIWCVCALLVIADYIVFLRRAKAAQGQAAA